jgi:hypothetical protein
MILTLNESDTAKLIALDASGNALFDLTTAAGSARGVGVQVTLPEGVAAVEIGEELVSLLDADGEAVAVYDPDDLAALIEAARTPDLASAKAAKLEALKQARHALERAGVTVGANEIPTDAESVSRITGAYIRAQNNASFEEYWKVGPGEYVTIDQTAMLAIGQAVFTHISNAFAAERTAAASVEAATTIEAVEAVTL